MHNNQAIPFNKENFKLIFSKEFVLVILLSIPSAMLAEFFDVPLAWFLNNADHFNRITYGFKNKNA